MKKTLRYLFKILVGFTLSVIIGAVVLFLLVNGGAFGPIPSKMELGGIVNEEASLIYSSQGAVIGKVYHQNRINIPFEAIPQHVLDALIATEDKRFFEHEGVDFLSYMRVLFRTLLSLDESGGGGSTISQQVVKNIYGRTDHGVLSIPVNKIREALIAADLEEVYTKEEILGLYLNTVPFGRNTYGLESAAQYFFSRSANELRIEQGAMLIGMLKANTAFDPVSHPIRCKERRDVVLRLMDEQAKLSDRPLDSLINLPLDLQMTNSPSGETGYFTAWVQQLAAAFLQARGKRTGQTFDLNRDGLRIYTTLDTSLQRMAVRSARTHLQSLQHALDRQLKANGSRAKWEKQQSSTPNDGPTRRTVLGAGGEETREMSTLDSLWHYHSMLHCSVLMTEVGTGKVRVWVGGRDHRYLPYDLVRSKRQSASAFKPILYAAAIENGAQPCDYFSNEQKVYEEYDAWEPRNFDGSTGNKVAMWYALARSMNLPTVDLYFQTGPEALTKMCAAMQLPEPNAESPAVSLGSMEVSLAELVRAYSAFAQNGKMMEQRCIERIEDRHGNVLYQASSPKARQVCAEETAYQISQMLEQAVEMGTCQSLRGKFGLRTSLAAKTGTSQHYSDAWTVAYNDKMVVGTWVGAMDRSIHFRDAQGSGSKAALPVLGALLADVQRNEALAERYLAANPTKTGATSFECPPERKGLDEFLDNLFGKKDKQDADKSERERKLKRWLDQVFKKKDKE